MRFAQFFIHRPIFAAVIWTIVTLIGFIAFKSLPLAQYPNIAPPTIEVRAIYPGASAETVAETVAATIEEEINGVENMLYIASQSTSAGTATITVTFKPGTDLDTAQVLVQNRVSLAEPRLPEAVRRLGISTAQANPDALLVVHLYSPDNSRDQLYLSNYARLQMRDELQRINGVGQVQMFGLREYSMRIWIDPDRAAGFGLTAGDIVRALRAQNVEVAGGVLDQLPNPGRQGAFEISVQTQGRLSEPEEFERVIIHTTPDGRQVRVRDIARIELGAREYATSAQLDTSPALALLFNQQPGSNALDTAETILSTVERMSQSFPEGVAYDVIWNPTEFVAESIHEVEKTIFEAIILVSLVVFIFLQSVRAAIIPIIAIPISLVGTFAVMQVFGFSLNMLSLFGLVLAIGIVVDDAIVVVENVERKISEGLSPKAAAIATLDEVGGALVSIGLVLTAVFVPTAFLEGITGEFYRQFAVTVASATIISVCVSLTLSPALASLLLKPHRSIDQMPIWQRPMAIFFAKFNAAFDATSRGYVGLMRKFTRMSAIVLVVYGGLIALTYVQMDRAPKGFIPATDQNYVIAVVQLPAGASLSRTEEVMNRVIADGLAHPHVAHAAAFAGLNGATFTTASNSAAIFFPMTQIKERLKEGYDINRVIGDLRGTFASYTDAMILVVPPPPVRGIGNAGGFMGYVQDRSGAGYQALEGQAWVVAGGANAAPEASSAFTLFNTATPQLFTDIDRVRAEQLGISVEDIFETLEIYLGSAYVNDFTAFGRPFRVTAQADADYRNRPEDIARLRTRNGAGDMVPLGSVATFSDTTGPNRIARYNLYPAASVQGDITPGYSSGQTLAAVERVTENLAPGFTFEWTGLSLQERLAGNTAAIAFLLAVVFVFLLLAAQYESLTLPLAVILIVPMTLLSSITGVLARGFDMNILVQIGFVMLIGLAAKNSILIVEFARQAHRDGQSVTEAALSAARLRLRPIIMTSVAFILGVVPLMIASGAAYEMRQSLGTSVFFGMLGVTIFGLAFTPTFFVVTTRLGELVTGKKPTATSPLAEDQA
ncbi:efflux RND transporter permease subunit [Woodsholea maritima]|uniref:efflux RND transporter permease subunit n=1 Tax=Woodsholea maritima TaxID=240237 RepID=UPI00036C53AC|nr:multidrug efflux RND transporter permease subunit [Woodsholea maritima]